LPNLVARRYERQLQPQEGFWVAEAAGLAVVLGSWPVGCGLIACPEPERRDHQPGGQLPPGKPLNG
jgi:hypothetical protein